MTSRSWPKKTSCFICGDLEAAIHLAADDKSVPWQKLAKWSAARAACAMHWDQLPLPVTKLNGILLDLDPTEFGQVRWCRSSTMIPNNFMNTVCVIGSPTIHCW